MVVACDFDECLCTALVISSAPVFLAPTLHNVPSYFILYVLKVRVMSLYMLV